MPKIIFFNDGTAAVGKYPTPDSLMGKLYHYLAFDPGNIVWDLYEHCKEPNKYYFPGPGTDICFDLNQNFISKLIFTVGGLVYGNIGFNGLANNLRRIQKILKAFAQKHPGEPIELSLVGWSRGAYLNWLIKNECRSLIKEGIEFSKINIIYIDPVIGGPFDRLHLFWNSGPEEPPFEEEQRIEIRQTVFYSNSGNLKIWDLLSRFFNYNMPFFSAFDPENAKADNQSCAKYLVNANHEEIVGKEGSANGALVKFIILHELTNNGLLFDEKLRAKNAKDVLSILAKTNTTLMKAKSQLLPNPRCYLSTQNCFFGGPFPNSGKIKSIEEAFNKEYNDDCLIYTKKNKAFI